jgi:hypothetical protein
MRVQFVIIVNQRHILSLNCTDAKIECCADTEGSVSGNNRDTLSSPVLRKDLGD